MEVCVNLTHPHQDIRDETVRVNVFNNESSVYIPDGAEIASMSIRYLMDLLNLHHSFSPRCFQPSYRRLPYSSTD